ncbi:hypothetical protein [Micromonospora sp. NPDC051141]|uniref:hypothetical protein n=1 Tax=Micromonospora sp. NPDC051141 TaxID=3364284 RepID=UPI0037AA7B72
MSDLPPSGSTEPVPPADPARPTPPPTGPVPEQSGPSGSQLPAAGEPPAGLVPGPSGPSGSHLAAGQPPADQPSADQPPAGQMPVGQMPVGQPSAGQPPAGQMPVDPWADLTTAGQPYSAPPAGWPHSAPPAGWPAPPGWPAAPEIAPPGWPAAPDLPSGWSAPGTPSQPGTPPPGTPPPGWPATPPFPPGGPAPGSTPPGGWHWPAAGPAHPGQPMPGAPFPGQPMPGAGYPGQPMPGAVYPGPPMPGAAYPGHPGPGVWYPGLDPQDPLVTPPYAGVGGWFARCAGAVRRGWRQLLPIMLFTQGVPAAVISVLSLFLVPTDEMATGPDGAPVLPDGYLEHVFVFYGAVLLAALVFGPLQAVGWGAGTWVVARQAAGEPAGLGGALRYGVRRALGLWGWTIVVSLLITVGACLCLLPGIYAGFAVALFGPVYLFERQEPVGRAWRMFHNRFGMVLGRVALVACALVAAAVLDAVVGAVSGAVFGTDPMSAPGTAVGAVTLAVVGAALAAPAYLAQLVGLVVAYAEQRAHEGPVNAARLAAELG